MKRRVHWPMLALAVLLAGAPAVGQGRGRKPAANPEQEELARLVATLCAPQGASQERYDAYRKLSTLRHKDAVPLLVKALPEATLHGQNLGLSLLQSYPRDVSGPALRTLMAAKEAYLAAGAAAWIWRSEDRSVGPRIVETLGRASKEERLQILGALYAIKDDKVQSAVRALLAPDAGTQLLDLALYHLLTAEDGKAGPVAAVLLRTPGLPVDDRALLSAFLLATGDQGASAEFATAVASATVAGLQRLPRFLERAPRLDEAAKAALVRLLETAGNTAQRAAVARILARHPSARANATLEQMLASDDVVAARAAFDALVAGGAIAREQLVLLLGRAPQMALLAADMLRRMDDLQGLPRARELASQPGPERVEALRVVARFRTKDAVPPLLAALEDADLAARTAAFQGLQQLLPDLFPFRRFDPAAAYSASAPEPQRREAAARIQAWWQSASASLK